jgi:hypothetical protein
MTGGTDRTSRVRAWVDRESAVAVETALQYAMPTEEGVTPPISLEYVH